MTISAGMLVLIDLHVLIYGHCHKLGVFQRYSASNVEKLTWFSHNKQIPSIYISFHALSIEVLLKTKIKNPYMQIFKLKKEFI